MKGILFDLPHVVERARHQTASEGLSDRCELVGSSFFNLVPKNADAYVMRNIIHDWDEEKALTILQNCHRGISSSSKLLVIEAVISCRQ